MKNNKKMAGTLCVALRQMSQIVGRRSTSPFGSRVAQVSCFLPPLV